MEYKQREISRNMTRKVVVELYTDIRSRCFDEFCFRGEIN